MDEKMREREIIPSEKWSTLVKKQVGLRFRESRENQCNSHTIITTRWELSPLKYILYLLHLLETRLQPYLKAFWFFLLLIFFAFFFWAYHAWAYKREKKYPIMLSQKHHNFAMPKHTDVILWLAGFSGEMVIYAFLLGFFSPFHQKE